MTKYFIVDAEKKLFVPDFVNVHGKSRKCPDILPDNN